MGFLISFTHIHGHKSIHMMAHFSFDLVSCFVEEGVCFPLLCETCNDIEVRTILPLSTIQSVKQWSI